MKATMQSLYPYNFSPELALKLKKVNPDSSVGKIKTHINRCNELFERTNVSTNLKPKTVVNFKQIKNQDGDVLIKSMVSTQTENGVKSSSQDFKLSSKDKNLVMAFAEKISDIRHKIERL